MRKDYVPELILTEKQSKDILKRYDIPVVRETIAVDEDEAVCKAEAIGFPVVVKGLAARIAHKTEHGFVHLNLADSQAVRQAVRFIAAQAVEGLEGYLIQPQIHGKRELVAGLFRDEQFGPVVMFGMGGIFTEVFDDVTFRLAPLNESDALTMLDDIRCKALLDRFRGEAAVNRRQLVQTLTGLSRIGMEFPEIKEIDINPLLADSRGNICAVDALIVKNSDLIEKPLLRPVDPAIVKSFFFPESVAIVGASNTFAKWGHMLTTNALGGGFAGRIYPVNSREERICGRTVYRTVNDIPAAVDLAVVTIPACGVSDLIPQFRKKGIRRMLLVTSGFGEVGTNGKSREKDFTESAQAADIYLIGPNTMGICSPGQHFYCTSLHVRPMPGSTAVASQSGNVGNQILAFAEEQGLGIRVFAGSGNEAMITVEDYLDFFETDEGTRIILLYVESLKNTRRFFKNARRTGRRKPIILLKGGQSDAGNRAAVSHTGALASDAGIFNAACRQSGIIKVEETSELLELAAAFESLPLPKGNRAGIITLGGGWGVIAADQCARYGIDVPVLTPEIIQRIDKILPPFWSRTNPVDMVGQLDNTIPLALLEEMLRWKDCDAVISLGILGRRLILKRIVETVERVDPSYPDEILRSVTAEYNKFENYYIQRCAELMKKYRKPIYGVRFVTGKTDHAVQPDQRMPYHGVFFPTPAKAVRAFARMYEYHEFRNREHHGADGADHSDSA